MTHVEALDAQGRLGQLEMITQLVERLRTRVVIGGAAQTVAGELLLRVAVDGLEQGPLVATVRHADLDLRLAQL